MIIDFHTHAFPDFLAPRAIPTLAENSGLTPYHDGTAAGLIARMDKSGIDRSVVLNIATNAHQELSVNRFAVSLLESERLIPFGSVFPGSDTWEQTLDYLAENGIRGIKLHPEYQNFDLDCDEAFKVYEKCGKLGLLVSFHSGHDAAFTTPIHTGPDRINRVCTLFPQTTFIAAHFGGYDLWEETAEKLKDYDAVSLLEKMNVRVLCTTDDPADTLEWHKKIAADPSIPFRVLPSFRPDKYLGGNPDAERALCEKYGTDSLTEALEKALDYFCENGCRVSDHGFSKFAYVPGTKQAELLHFLGKAYHAHGVAMQLHLGPIRNQNPRLYETLGPDAGGDSVGLTTDPFQLGAFLGDLERENSLPNTILYDLNPADNAMLSTMAVNFAPKVQFGAAWWFNDTIRGMRRQIDELMENGLLAKSVGMLTDSRSFSSFPRHEYYRRILCQKLGELVESGQYPADEAALGKLVENVCCKNAETFFGF